MARIAHELNNVLTIIVGQADLLLADLPPGDPARDPLQRIRSVADDAASLSRELLAVGGRQELRASVVDLNAVVSSTSDLLRPVLGDAIRLGLDLAPVATAIRAVPIQLQQIVLNLALNARDAMPDGGDLMIGTSAVDVDDALAARRAGLRPGPYAVLTVADTGCGIDPAVRARLFEPFVTTKAPGRGTGLGLATVYGLVKRSGGYITVESEPGRGTVFEILLPRAGTEQTAPGPSRWRGDEARGHRPEDGW